MSKYARMKSRAGGAAIPTIASAATIRLPNDASAAFITGTTAVTSLLSDNTILPGREFTFIGATATGNVFTNTTSASANGQMYLAGGNIRVDTDDVLVLKQLATGAWRLVSYQQAVP